MKTTLSSAILALGALSMAHAQQPATSQPQSPQAQAPQTQGTQTPGAAQGQGSWQGQRGGRGIASFGMGRGTIGTVTEAAADHYTIKTELGETYTVHFSVNTRIMKQAPGGPGAGPNGEFGRRQGRGSGSGQGAGQASGQTSGQGQGQGVGNGDDAGPVRTPPQPIKATDIKVGDVITAGGEVDANAKSVGAVFVMLIDPERAKEMRAMEANFGKTWLAGRVTAINETKVNLESGGERGAHSFVADENTTFRKRRDPITLADVQVGDMVRVEGAVKDGTFVATSVAVMGAPPNGPRGAGDGPPQPAAPPQ